VPKAVEMAYRGDEITGACLIPIMVSKEAHHLKWIGIISLE
jgi:hypothetical protein